MSEANKSTTNIIYLVNKMPRYGRASGYEQLASYVCRLAPETKMIRPERTLLNRIMGKAFSVYHHWPKRDQTNSAAELNLSITMTSHPHLFAHILYIEYHLFYLGCLANVPPNLIGTIHEPMKRWQNNQGMEAAEHLKKLKNAIIMYSRDLEYFESIIGKGRVHLILHGVDTEFFCPPIINRGQSKCLLYVGVYLRNTAMIKRVITSLYKTNPRLKFDLVVTREALTDANLAALLEHPAVTWHHGISDEDLRSLYQNSYLALLPMNDSGANNAVVEALASGLPLVTTDCGGIRDYGGGSIFPIVENDDDEAMIALVNKYLDGPEWRNSIASQCREFAVQNLAWPIIAEKHLDLYQRLSSTP